MCPNCQVQLDRFQPAVERKYNTKLNIANLSIAQMIAIGMGGDPYKVAGIQTHTVPVEPILKKLKDNK